MKHSRDLRRFEDAPAAACRCGSHENLSALKGSGVPGELVSQPALALTSERSQAERAWPSKRTKEARTSSGKTTCVRCSAR